MSTKEAPGIVTSQTQEYRDALECEADMMTELSRLFGQAYMRGRAHGRNEAQKDTWAEPSEKPGTFDEGLVERLARARHEHFAQSLKRKGQAAVQGWHELPTITRDAAVEAMHGTLSELASMPVEMPTAEDFRSAWAPRFGATLTSRSKQARDLVYARLGPILAAKDFRNQALDNGNVELCRQITAKDARIAELEQRGERIVELELTNESNRQRIAELEKRLADTERSLEWHKQQATAATVELDCTGMTLEEAVRATMRRLDKQTPVDATGKTPEQVFRMAAAEHGTDRPILDVTNEERIDAGIRAVLRAFGGAEVLRRARERIEALPTHFVGGGDVRQPHTAKGTIKDAVAIIDDKLAKLGGQTDVLRTEGDQGRVSDKLALAAAEYAGYAKRSAPNEVVEWVHRMMVRQDDFEHERIIVAFIRGAEFERTGKP